MNAIDAVTASDMRGFVRAKVHLFGYSAAARWFANRGIGNPRWFLLLTSDLLPKVPR